MRPSVGVNYFSINNYFSHKVRRMPRVAYEEGDFDIVSEPPEGDTHPQVVTETVTEAEEGEPPNNVIKRLLLNSSNQKLDVIMLK